MKKATYLIIITGLLSACTSKTIQELEEDILIPETVYYSPEIETIIDNHCISCHQGAGASGNVTLDTYENVRLNTEEGNLLIRINDSQNPMPPTGLIPEALRENFQKWSEANFPISDQN